MADFKTHFGNVQDKVRKLEAALKEGKSAVDVEGLFAEIEEELKGAESFVAKNSNGDVAVRAFRKLLELFARQMKGA